MVTALLGPGDQAWILSFDEHACWTAEELARAIPSLAAQLHRAETAEQGLAQLVGPGPLPVVTGSLHLLGSLLDRLDPAAP